MEDHEPEARIRGWMTLTKILVPTCRYCLNCTKFGQLIFRKIIKIVATRCPILRLKCIKFDSICLQRSPRPPRGPTSKGREGGEVEELGGKGREGGEGVGAPFNVLPPGATDLVAPLLLVRNVCVSK